MLTYGKPIIRDQKGRCVFVSSNNQTESSSLRERRIGVLPGQYYDGESGLHYNYYRYYSPQEGRYITSDPIGLNGGLNTFGYAMSNPLKYTDPFGLSTCGSGFNESFVPNNPFRFNFSSCCGTHDDCYGNCDASKESCDNNFLGCMLNACESEGGPARKSICEMWARRYYNSVNWLGQSAYDDAQEDCPDCEK